MEEKNQNIEESNKKDLTQEEIEDVQGESMIDVIADECERGAFVSVP